MQKYDHAILRNLKGEVVAETDLNPPHKNVWTVLRDLSRKR